MAHTSHAIYPLLLGKQIFSERQFTYFMNYDRNLHRQRNSVFPCPLFSAFSRKAPGIFIT
jgi:hypothetical protein